jgi:hypothetical protein
MIYYLKSLSFSSVRLRPRFPDLEDLPPEDSISVNKQKNCAMTFLLFRNFED